MYTSCSAVSPAVIAAAIVSIRLAAPVPPTIWPPSRRPVASSASSFTLTLAVPGK